MIDREVMAGVAAKAGLKAIQNGMRLNSAYTPRNCMAAASRFTGKTYKARDYQRAIDDIQIKLDDINRTAIYDQAERHYGEAGVNAIESSCLTTEDFRKGWSHCDAKIRPALEEMHDADL